MAPKQKKAQRPGAWRFHKPRRSLYFRLTLGELTGILRFPNDAGLIMDKVDIADVEKLEKKGLRPEAAAAELALRCGLEPTSTLGSCPYCARDLDFHAPECALVEAKKNGNSHPEPGPKARRTRSTAWSAQARDRSAGFAKRRPRAGDDEVSAVLDGTEDEEESASMD